MITVGEGMITKISSITPINFQKPRTQNVCYTTPSFGQIKDADKFIKEAVIDNTPVTLKNAISLINKSISSNKFKKIAVPIVEDDDPLIALKNMILSAEKTTIDGQERILVRLSYDNGDINGYSILANSSKSKVLSTVEDSDFLTKIKVKMKHMSDKLEEEPEVIDLRG